MRKDVKVITDIREVITYHCEYCDYVSSSDCVVRHELSEHTCKHELKVTAGCGHYYMSFSFACKNCNKTLGSTVNIESNQANVHAWELARLFRLVGPDMPDTMESLILKDLPEKS